jgi:hypothetical protein
MHEDSTELTLEEALADPLIRAVMKADRVDPKSLADDLRRIAAGIDWQYVIPSPSVAECRASR